MTIEEIFNIVESKYKDIVYVTDDNVYSFYKQYFNSKRCYVIEHGETSKNLTTVEKIYNWLIDNNITKHSCIVGVGGGIVTDITGYVASTYKRGTKFGFISTTLLGMIDASIGGKNGVNFNDFKNMIGTINQPDFCFYSEEFLVTLPKEEIHSAFGEILKYAIGFSRSLFETLEKNSIDDILVDKQLLSEVVSKCIYIKRCIVNDDPNESEGTRIKLNLGHTVAHAIEKTTNYKISHGEAVGIGLNFITEFSKSENWLQNRDYIRIMNLLNKYGFHKYDEVIHSCINYIGQDKKSIDDEYIDLVLVKWIGNCFVGRYKKDQIINYINKN